MEQVVVAGRVARPEAALGAGERIWRDARTRLLAAAGVVLVHSAYPPGHAVLAALPPGSRLLASAGFQLLVSVPVNAFVLLAFLSLGPRVAAGVPTRQLLRTAARRLVPAHLAWVTAFLALRALAEHALPGPRAVVEGVVLGTAASHLYFTPLLLALTAFAPALSRRLPGPATLALGAAAAALASLGLHLWLGRDDAWRAAASGIIGYVPFALAGLWLHRSWGGVAPPPARARRVAAVAGAVALLSAALLVHAAVNAAGGLPVRSPISWLAGLGFGLSVPILLLCLPSRPWAGRARLARLAGLTLGVYFVHPIFVQLLRRAEAAFAADPALALGLVLPNAALAAALSLGTVMLLARSPLRKMVA
ncbi:MAG: acyltransferase family protein [Anaeromyxobacter sp.]